MSVVKFMKTLPNAVVPTKGNEFAVGYDLTVVEKTKQIAPDTWLYSTGIAVQPPYGYYTEVYPRSSLAKSGNVLANSVGVIDNDFRGAILVAIKGNNEIKLPFTGFQLVLRKQEFFTMKEEQKLEETVRGDGSFGSTDNKEVLIDKYGFSAVPNQKFYPAVPQSNPTIKKSHEEIKKLQESCTHKFRITGIAESKPSQLIEECNLCGFVKYSFL